MSIGIGKPQPPAPFRPRVKPIVYPDSDGKRMAENTKQFDLIVVIKTNFDVIYENDPNVFVAGDLLWYPVEGDNKTRQAPDTMLAFGRPKGYRGSYKQWEEGGIAPQVVFEILSPGNRSGEMQRKFEFYEKYGVEEYCVYDPDRNRLRVWLRQEERLIEQTIQNGNWTSPRTGVRLDIASGDLKCHRPDGRPFLSLNEIQRQNDRLQNQNTELQTQNTDLQTENDRLKELLKAAGINLESLG